MEINTDRNSSAREIIREVSRVIAGKDAVSVKVLLAILAGGHILMEDIPGVGKTTLAVSMSRALGLDYNRVQFTPDVLPSDITGYSLYDKNTSTMLYQKGAILCEVMEERKVSVDGVTRNAPVPFLVIATQNPSGAAGTQLLPDSQLDRFMLRLTMGYPAHADEIEMVRRRQGGISAESVRQIVTREELLNLRREVDQVFIKDSLIEYIVTLCEKTRDNSRILQGASPRASLALTSLAKAAAWLQKRDFVLPQDVRFSFYDCVEHRLIWQQEVNDPAARASVLGDILKAVKAPAIQ